MPFFHRKSSNTTFLTSEKNSSRSTDNIIQELNTVANMYTSRGFNIGVYHRENEFDINDLGEHIRNASLNICAQEFHIPIIEQSIKTINK